MKTGFDNSLYVNKQAECIRERIKSFGGKLYLEFGGKLFDDYHASRVLPGFDINGKIKLLQEFADTAEIVFCINAADIEKNKIRADFGITYDQDILRQIDSIRKMDLLVSSVIITQYKGQVGADTFRNKLEQRGIKTYLHYPIQGYPVNIDYVVSEDGFGKNDYIETSKSLVVITAPGPCSGKLATCLSQLYHENKRGIDAGYAKFETFPIWDIPLKHPVNLAYEAATADLKDVNMIDPFHLEAYGITAINYNRDIEVFPVVKNMLNKIKGREVYKSPTDMGVNMATYGIVDDLAVREAAKQEIIRRYFKACCDYKLGRVDAETAPRVEMIMNELGVSVNDRTVVAYAKAKEEKTKTPSMAIELKDGTIITGKTSELLDCCATTLLNAIKHLAGLADDILLISPIVLEPILDMKNNILHTNSSALNMEEVLIAISICAATNPVAAKALSKLPELKNCEAHTTSILLPTNEDVMRRLFINTTSGAEYSSEDLYTK
ncbi:MAG: DUF1846 domain-containing protein [Filifactoraceae bacterium]